MNLTDDELAARCLAAAADIDYLTLDDDSDDPADECDPPMLALRALTIALRIAPDRDIAAAIHNSLAPMTDAHDESDCAICILAADHMR